MLNTIDAVAVPDQNIIDESEDFLKNSVDLNVPPKEYPDDQFWAGLRAVGSELWLDTGDMEGAAQLWNKEFSALTTNNTLLNKEIQKGIYDDIILEANKLVKGLDELQRIVEIAFILNAHHALRLVQRFGAQVSVELHTALAHDPEATVLYAQRFHRICPSNFIIKIPHTPSGLLSTRKVRDLGIPVNYTLGFSARQNYIATAMAHPSYVNVFLGRLNSFVADNSLGTGDMVGEKTTLASQEGVQKVSQQNRGSTRQIAASMRAASQVADLAGVDVYTMPVTVASAAKKELDGHWESKRHEEYNVALNPDVPAGELHLEKLWEISEKEENFVRDIRENMPADERELLQQLKDAGIHDFFPEMSGEESATIIADGKIPQYTKWRGRIKEENLSVDSLINMAGLGSFTTDQASLDNRIRKLIS
ncbi:MAG: transaldolase [Chitinivibrionales bacterium]|nr:transaldolase [Chitinivibrionales bacterium]